jgi:hypothetical protein
MPDGIFGKHRVEKGDGTDDVGRSSAAVPTPDNLLRRSTPLLSSQFADLTRFGETRWGLNPLDPHQR